MKYNIYILLGFIPLLILSLSIQIVGLIKKRLVEHYYDMKLAYEKTNK